MKQTGMLVVSLRCVNFWILVSLRVFRAKRQYSQKITPARLACLCLIEFLIIVRVNTALSYVHFIENYMIVNIHCTVALVLLTGSFEEVMNEMKVPRFYQMSRCSGLPFISGMFVMSCATIR